MNNPGSDGDGRPPSERDQAEKVQAFLLEVLRAASTSSGLEDMLSTTHRALGKLMDTSNFYVALYDEATGLYSFPFRVDRYDTDDPPPHRLPYSLTDYVRRTGRALYADQEVDERLIREGHVRLVGAPSVLWLGVPLQAGEQVIGVVAVQSYEDETLYSHGDLELLTAISNNVALVVQRKRFEEESRRSEERFRALFEASPDAIFVEDLDGKVLDVNPAACKLQGIDADTLVGMNVSELVPPEASESSMEIFGQLVRGEREQAEGLTLTADGRSIPVDLRVNTLEYDGQPALLVQVRDITKRKEYEEQIEHLARFDGLTRLPNRFLLEDRLQQALLGARRRGDCVALHYLDLDDFKNVNATIGHSLGDQLLKAVAARLGDLVRDSDTVARLGGDEFAIVQPAVSGPEAATILAGRILKAMFAPFRVGGHKIHISVSSGISLSSPSTNPIELMVQADRALFKAKAEGRSSFRFHDQSLAEEVQKYVTLREDLLSAVEREEFFLEYQPQVNLKTGEIVGSEALIRWQHPRRGLLSPGVFIPVTENTGLIKPIGEWVLKEACRQTGRWLEGGLPEIPIAVNLSALQIRDARFDDNLGEVLEDTGINPRLLELELTETVLMRGSDGILAALLQANDRGIRISIDDFGTGYSSLRYLREFPVHKLKVAMEFVQGVADDADDRAIVGAVIGLGHELGMSVIAEGVETQEQVDFLTANGCDEAQGYFYSRPVSAEKFAEHLAQGQLGQRAAVEAT